MQIPKPFAKKNPSGEDGCRSQNRLRRKIRLGKTVADPKTVCGAKSVWGRRLQIPKMTLRKRQISLAFSSEIFPGRFSTEINDLGLILDDQALLLFSRRRIFTEAICGNQTFPASKAASNWSASPHPPPSKASEAS